MKRQSVHFWEREWIGRDAYSTCKHCGVTVYMGDAGAPNRNLSDLRKADRQPCKAANP